MHLIMKHKSKPSGNYFSPYLLYRLLNVLKSVNGVMFILCSSIDCIHYSCAVFLLSTAEHYFCLSNGLMFP